MEDKVYLQIGGKRVERFNSYSVDADLYNADDAFSMELTDPETEVKAGMRCQLYVNDSIELDGIIDRVTRGYSKQGSRLRAEGRDLMGVLVDSYAEDFVTLENKKIKDLAEMMIGQTARHPALPFVSRLPVEYQQNIVGKGRGKKQTVSQPLAGFLETEQKISQVEQGMTVFGWSTKRAAHAWSSGVRLPRETPCTLLLTFSPEQVTTFWMARKSPTSPSATPGSPCTARDRDTRTTARTPPPSTVKPSGKMPTFLFTSHSLPGLPTMPKAPPSMRDC